RGRAAPARRAPAPRPARAPARGPLARGRAPRARRARAAPRGDARLGAGRYVYLGPALGPREEEGVTGNAFTWNREGFHDADHEVAKPRGRVRVALLG